MRKRAKFHITRMEPKRLQSGELWYLRLVLQHSPARSYEQLQTVNGVTYTSFSETTAAMGLLENITEAEICMDKARNGMCSPRQIRFLFTVLITEGAPSSLLFNKNSDFMLADYQLNKSLPYATAPNEMLKNLVPRLESYGRTLSDFNLPKPCDNPTEIEKEKLTRSRIGPYEQKRSTI